MLYYCSCLLRPALIVNLELDALFYVRWMKPRGQGSPALQNTSVCSLLTRMLNETTSLLLKKNIFYLFRIVLCVHGKKYFFWLMQSSRGSTKTPACFSVHVKTALILVCMCFKKTPITHFLLKVGVFSWLSLLTEMKIICYRFPFYPICAACSLKKFGSWPDYSQEFFLTW